MDFDENRQTADEEQFSRIWSVRVSCFRRYLCVRVEVCADGNMGQGQQHSLSEQLKLVDGT